VSAEGPSDRDLVAAYLARRDEASFRRLYHRHAPALYSFAVRALSGSGRDAEELVHDTWIRACERLAGFRWESGLATWLCSIALNRCRELRRERAREAGIVPPPELGSPATAGASGDLAKALSKLPEGQREILLLHDLQGFSHSEIGALLGIEAGTSKSQLFHARRTARALLQGADDE
jgi:RNA polymerase sigma-70 factor (ECF subfamily)